jgi:hypothetical protein
MGSRSKKKEMIVRLIVRLKSLIHFDIFGYLIFSNFLSTLLDSLCSSNCVSYAYSILLYCAPHLRLRQKLSTLACL